MARLCNQALIANLPASFSWKRAWTDPDLEGILEVKTIEMPLASEAHSTKPKLLSIVDVGKAKWRRARLSLRGTDLQLRDVDPPFSLQSMHVLVPGYEARGVPEGSDVYIRLTLPVDKTEIFMRKPPVAPSVSPRSLPRPISPRTPDGSPGTSVLSVSGSPRFPTSIPTPSAPYLSTSTGVTDSIDDWLLALTVAPAMGHVRYVVDVCERIKTELLASLETVSGKDFAHVAMRHAALLRARQLASSLSDATLRDKLPHIVDPCLVALADVETSQEPHIVAVLSYVPPAEKPRAVSPRAISPRSRGAGAERKAAPAKDDAADSAFLNFVTSLSNRTPPPLSVERRNGQISTLPPALFSAPLSSITRLVLSGNSLASLPCEIGELRALEFLDLGNNYLTTLPQEIGFLAALKVVIISGNSIDVLPAAIALLPDTTTIEGLQALRYRVSLKLSLEHMEGVPRANSATYTRPSPLPCLCGSPLHASSAPSSTVYVQTQSWRGREHLFWAHACRPAEHTPNVYSVLHQVKLSIAPPPPAERKPSDKGGLLSEALDSLRIMKAAARGSNPGSSGGSAAPTAPLAAAKRSHGSSSGAGSP